MIEEIIKNNIKNLKLMTSIKTIKKYRRFSLPKYRKPFVIGGFEGGHIIAAIYDFKQ